MNNLEKEFAPYQESLELKELGFDEATSFYWENNVIKPLPMKDEVGAFHFNRHSRTEKEWICAPTFSQAFRWFREKYSDLDFGVAKIHNGTNNYHYHINLAWEFFEGTYEEAELACLRKLIEIVKEKQS